MNSPMELVLTGRRVDPVPIWLMRQAGRYLPEYREIRARARDFLDFCYSPALATEATLQPLRRFDLDAAIIFADILLVPHALGAKLRFVEGEGPLFEPVNKASAIGLVPADFLQRLAPVGETLERVRGQLPHDKAVIGFCGGVWTVATYLVEGRGGNDRAKARALAHDPHSMLWDILDILVEASALYLAMQARSGANILKIFDSWTNGLTDLQFETCVIKPTRKLVDRVREMGVTTPIIGFPRGAGTKLRAYVERSGVDAIALDQDVSPVAIGGMIPPQMAVQGNVDPLALLLGGDGLRREVDYVMEGFKSFPHILNLGHGITPDVPPEHVSQLIQYARDFSKNQQSGKK